MSKTTKPDAARDAGQAKFRIVPRAHTWSGNDIPVGCPDELGDFAEAMECSASDAMHMMEQYTFDDYFESGCGEDDLYDSAAEAHAAYKGDDCHGIGVRYDVEPVVASIDRASDNPRLFSRFERG